MRDRLLLAVMMNGRAHPRPETGRDTKVRGKCRTAYRSGSLRGCGVELRGLDDLNRAGIRS
jgi:hypothetical protein